VRVNDGAPTRSVPVRVKSTCSVPVRLVRGEETRRQAELKSYPISLFAISKGTTRIYVSSEI